MNNACFGFISKPVTIPKIRQGVTGHPVYY